MIKNFHVVKSTGEDNNSFVGIKIKGNDIFFHYPQAYDFDIESKNVSFDIIDLLQTISISKSRSQDSSSINNEYRDNDGFALYSYIWIINDYLQNGFYVNREKEYKVNQTGRINWKKTMQMQPIVSNGNIIYKDMVVETKNKSDNILVDIHKYCVKKSLSFIGWLFNLDPEMVEFNQTENDYIKSLYLSIIQKELDNTFDDNKKMRLIHFKNVITGLDISSNNDEFVYGVDTYYSIYEKMIDSIFGNNKNYKDINPIGRWHILSNDIFESYNSSKLRPDTILIEKNNMFILDAKFYNYGVTGKIDDLPETTSIQKQITYGDYIKTNLDETFNIEKIYNAFLIPFNKNGEKFKTEENMKYIGYSDATWKDKVEEHCHIHTFLIDLKYVVKTWNRNNHQEDINTLVENIIKYESKLLGN